MKEEKIINMNSEDDTPAIDSLEVFTLKLKKPAEYNGTSYNELHFDFSKLTGKDCLAIEDELIALGKNLVAPEVTSAYLVRLAARALEEPVGADFIESLPAGVYNRIRMRTRSFLLLSE